MQPAPMPIDEAARLDGLSLLDILDSPPEERFDRITRLAARLFEVPIALVSLVDAERQWFKSRCGLDATETPREVSFCGHAILDDAVFVVPDTHEDFRFADNPLVTGEPGVRFYAGCPLHGPHGGRLGTLCLIDREPRAFSEDECEVLRDLAAVVERELAMTALATTDELTGLANRRGFLKRGREAFSLCVRQRMPLSAVYIDLDGLKSINDRYGQGAGDVALVTLARHLRQCVREADVLARLADDEFALVLPGAHARSAQAAVDRLRVAIAGWQKQTGSGPVLRFSAGVVELDPARHGTFEDLVAEADASMYREKTGKTGT